MPRIERGQFSDLLRRYLGMTGESHVCDELAPEASPVFTLESERPEWEFLKNAKLMGMVSGIASGAAGGACRIRNPPNSGVIAIIDQWHFTASASIAMQMMRDFTTTDLTTGVTPIPRDSRLGGTGATGRSALVGSQQNTAGAFGDVFWTIGALANSPWYWPGPFVLHPGWAVTLVGAAAAAINGGVQWLEKRMDSLEFPVTGLS